MEMLSTVVKKHNLCIQFWFRIRFSVFEYLKVGNIKPCLILIQFLEL